MTAKVVLCYVQLVYRPKFEPKHDEQTMCQTPERKEYMYVYCVGVGVCGWCGRLWVSVGVGGYMYMHAVPSILLVMCFSSAAVGCLSSQSQSHSH